MFSLITNIYNKKTKVPTLMELFTATRKLNKFLRQPDMFDVCTTGDKAHIDTIFTFLQAWFIATVKNIDAPMAMRVRQELEYRFELCRVTRGIHIEHL
jgi:hypothetical protein